MTFHYVPRDIDFPLLKLASETGRWHLGWRLVFFGVRVSLSRAGEGGAAVDYCAGSSPAFRLELLRVLLDILGEVPEELTERELISVLPAWKKRPISHDETCWPVLQEMARLSRQKVADRQWEMIEQGITAPYQKQEAEAAATVAYVTGMRRLVGSEVPA